MQKMQTYRSLHPNHIHQLTVSVSKHYWITNEGLLKYQHKKMEVSLDKIKRSKKNHLILYIVRNHCSGVVYSEVSTSRKNIHLTEFLYRAWNKKNDFAFCGIPELLTVPKAIEKVFPGILESISLLGVQFPKVTSGFQAGAGDVKILDAGYPKIDALKQVSTIPILKNLPKPRQTPRPISLRHIPLRQYTDIINGRPPRNDVGACRH